MIKKEYYSFNEIAIISMIIIILRNIYIYFNLNIFLLIGSFFNFVYFNLHMSQYIEIFYAILIISYNILLLLSKKYFNLIVKYKLRMLDIIEKVQIDVQKKYCRKADKKIKEIMLKEINKTREEIIDIFMESWISFYKFI